MGIVEDVAKGAAKSLKPPTGGEDPGPWRRKVWLSILALAAILASHFAIDSGYGVPFGVWGPVVRADQLEQRLGSVEQRLSAIEAKQDTGLKLALAQEICRLYHLRNTADQGTALRIQLEQSFEEKQGEFSRVNGGFRYSVAECSPL